MSRRLLLIIAGALLLVLLVLGGIVLFQRRTPASNTNASNTNGALPNVNTVVLNTNQTKNTNTVNAGVLDPRTQVENLARSFASIYGSFSNQNNYENITSIYDLMAPALRSQQEAFVASEKAKGGDTSLYHGYTSVPQVTTVKDFNENAGTADVTITLQRTETSGSSSESTTYFQDITLRFQRLNGAWKVGSIAWSAKQ